jgi:excisionase family DNA binding protein
MPKRKESDNSSRAIPARLLHSKTEAAELLSLSERTIHRLVAAGELPTRQIGGRSLIPASALLEFAAVDHVAITPSANPKKATSKAANTIAKSSGKRTAVDSARTTPGPGKSNGKHL